MGPKGSPSRGRRAPGAGPSRKLPALPMWCDISVTQGAARRFHGCGTCGARMAARARAGPDSLRRPIALGRSHEQPCPHRRRPPPLSGEGSFARAADGGGPHGRQLFPGRRLFAVENGPSGFDPAAPVHQPKIKYLMLMRNEALARLQTSYDDATGVLTIREGDREAARGDLATREGRLAIEAFFRRFLPKELRGPPKVLAAPEGYRFNRFAQRIRLAHQPGERGGGRGHGRGAGRSPALSRQPARHRLPAFAELDLVGSELATDAGLRLKVTKRIVRCAATKRRPRHGRARPRDPGSAAEAPRPCRLRDLRRGGVGRGGAARGRAAGGGLTVRRPAQRLAGNQAGSGSRRGSTARRRRGRPCSCR